MDRKLGFLVPAQHEARDCLPRRAITRRLTARPPGRSGKPEKRRSCFPRHRLPLRGDNSRGRANSRTRLRFGEEVRSFFHRRCGSVFPRNLELWLGDVSAARSWTNQSLDLSQDQDGVGAAPLALAGDPHSAPEDHRHGRKKRARTPNSSKTGFLRCKPPSPFKRGNPAAAVEALKPPIRSRQTTFAQTFYRGLAYLSMKSAKKPPPNSKGRRPHGQFFLSSRSIFSANFNWPALSPSPETQPVARSAYQDLFASGKTPTPTFPP